MKRMTGHDDDYWQEILREGMGNRGKMNMRMLPPGKLTFLRNCDDGGYDDGVSGGEEVNGVVNGKDLWKEGVLWEWWGDEDR